ncbi:MAG: glycosyltransferase family 1 protein [Bacteroidetes bacterium]|nr:MAG: glycosyltransferase family 1 protein [Bacteroidota bacterium]TAF93290.1 MAG: glycosyltransferase family 1 protein [Bacteroidota bacterium]
MHIGFDAQMAFTNGTGLGHYSRTLLYSLAELYPAYHFHLFTQEQTDRVRINAFKNVQVYAPNAASSAEEKEYWMQYTVIDIIEQKGISVYHGLSHELPIGLPNTPCKSIVTVHDLLHERYPEIFTQKHHSNYTKKLQQACADADMVLAISEATRQDFEAMYAVPSGKLRVAVQSCNPAFYKRFSKVQLAEIATKYSLPPQFYLYVSNILTYKNLMVIVQAMHLLGADSLPLVVLGNGTDYKYQLQQYIQEHGLTHKVFFVSEMEAANSEGFRHATDLPAIYQLADCLIYPSFFEGWGIPVLEAMCAQIPVIASNTSSMPEVGGETVFYFDPYSADSLVTAIQQLANKPLVQENIAKAFQRSKVFNATDCAKRVHDLYTQLLQ